MNNPLKMITILLISGFLLFPSAIFAQESSDPKTEPKKEEKTFGETSWLSRGKELGPWYLVSSKFYDPHPEKWLYHVEAGLSYNEISGNVEGELWNVDAKLVLRKAPVTSNTTYAFRRDKTTVLATDSTTVVQKENFTEVLSYDIYTWLAIEGGFDWFNDSAKFYDDSYSFFAGVSVWPLNKKNLWLKLGAFGAHTNLAYRNDELEPLGIFMPDYSSPGVFFQETLHWQITKLVSLTQYFDYTYSFDESDPSLIYGFPTDERDNVIRWDLTASLNVALTSTIYLYISYSLVHDENPLSGTEGLLINYDEDDTTLAVGFKFVL